MFFWKQDNWIKMYGNLDNHFARIVLQNLFFYAQFVEKSIYALNKHMHLFKYFLWNFPFLMSKKLDCTNDIFVSLFQMYDERKARYKVKDIFLILTYFIY